MKKKSNAYYDLEDHNDEYYTGAVMVELLLPYIKPKSIIWCPFDTHQSEFVRVLDNDGHLTIPSHIWQGFDFFNFIPPKFDYIISNPPFSRKNDVLERLLDIGKPFALLLGLNSLNYVGIRQIVKDYNLQIIIPDKNVSYDGGTCPFTSVFFCYKMKLKSNMLQVKLRHKNTAKNFEPSAMYNLNLQY